MPTAAVATVIYALDPDRLAGFYAAVLGLVTAHREPHHTVLRAEGIELVLHALPPPVAAHIRLTQPATPREDTPIKPVFTVASLAEARRHAPALGGAVLPAEREWGWGGWRVCDAVDPEGNVIQLRECLRGPGDQPLRLISSKATEALLGELIALYAQAAPGQPVQAESVGGVDAARRVAAGEAVDVVVLARDAIARLMAAGHLRPGSAVDLADSGVAVAVPAGAHAPDTLPDIRTEAALRQAVLAARSIGISTGPSGTALARLFERWGVAEAVHAKRIVAPPGVPVGSLVASGEVALGFQQLSELMRLPGITVLGPLPPEVQITTTFTGAVAATSERAPAAAALLAFLAGDQQDEAKRRNGMTATTPG